LQHPALILTRRALILTTYLAFACRLMIPAGYMPAALGEGGPVTLCPMGLPAGLLPEHSGHHHDGGESRGADLLWEYCPVGALADTASTVPHIVFHLPVFQEVRPGELEPTSVVSRPLPGFRSRAPPFFVV